MKTLVKLSFIIPVVFIVGIVLDAVGNNTGNATLAKVGVYILSYGIPATMFLLVVIGLILLITGMNGGKKSDVTFRDDEEEKADGDAENLGQEMTAADREAQKLNEINSSYGYSSQLKAAEYQMEHTAKIYKNSTRREKILGWLFFGFLMTDFAMIMVFGFLRIDVGAFVCLGIFAGTIVLSLIIKIIREKVSMSQKVNFDKYDLTKGRVMACLFSSMSSTGGSRTTRVTGVTYRIVIDVNGRAVNAYSREAYDEGEIINVLVKKNGKGMARIIGPDKEDSAEESVPWQERAAQREANLAQLAEELNAMTEEREAHGEGQNLNGNGEEANDGTDSR